MVSTQLQALIEMLVADSDSEPVGENRDVGGFLPKDKSISSTETKGFSFAGSEVMLTPERSIEIQNAIGADIIMQLDDVVKTTTIGPRVEEAMHRLVVGITEGK